MIIEETPLQKIIPQELWGWGGVGWGESQQTPEGTSSPTLENNIFGIPKSRASDQEIKRPLLHYL